MQQVFAMPEKRKKPVILGTDWHTDCDDAVAIRILAWHQWKGCVHLLGVSIDSAMACSAASMRTFLAHERLTGVPVGLDHQATDYGGVTRYQPRLAAGMDWEAENRSCEEAVRLYRRLLAEARQPVTLIEIGFLQVLEALMDSGPDDLSPLSGRELIASRVSELWVMGGRWDGADQPEFNFSKIPRARRAAHRVLEGWPGEVTLLGWEAGCSVYSGGVLERACTHSVGPYCYQNTDIRGYGYYTNNPPAGAFRGFGVCQSEFALESNINLLAEKVGISPWEIRYRNAIEPGKVLPNGQIADCSTALKETLLAVKDAYESNPGRAGIACAMKNAGVGVGLPDKGRAKLVVHNGKIELYSAASDIGQGCKTVFVQMVAETTGLGKDRVINMGANSEVAPDSGTTSGSRQTLITGEAVRMAAADLNKDLQAAGGDLEKLEGKEYFAEFFDPTDKLGADVPNPKSHVAYGFATHVVILDDDGRVKEVYAAHDSGKVVNPISIQGQIEGGVLMGLGYALTEDFPLKDGVPQAKYGTLGLMRSTQIPDIHAIYVEKEELLPFAYGAKGIGEIATIPTAPAAQGAYYAMDHVLRTKLPMEDTYYSKKQKAVK